MKKIAVVGAGTMGSGIAQTAACAGFQAVVRDVDRIFLDRARQGIEKSLRRILEKRDPQNAPDLFDQVLKRIHFSTEWEDLADADFVIEAINEDFNLKSEVFRELDRITDKSVILASNTSSISITSIAAGTDRPDRVVGMHFMNPVPLMKLVEVIRGLQTSQQTCDATRALAEEMGKTPVEVKDFPGFVSNRVLMPMLNEAMFAMLEGVASAESIDTIMKLGMNHPMGPLQLADFIGLDVCLDILNELYEGFRDPKYRPCPLLSQMVAAGYLGKKSGRGFYEYDK
ncbi:MAG TPA: 3-hydroxybutyryl-CoA dehydrogenase [Acidobacteriota bacterium]|jgi:3-hydroxybutyryl-CoA dehydrogenase|nr:3-hydroxybutyryl-CoA dehydrogenase [Acidobacteriota bacterium]